MDAPSKSSIRDTYDRIAASFAASRKAAWPEVLAFIAELPARSRVLDLGCGNGRHLRALLERGHRAVGVDFSRRLLLLARSALAADCAVGEATRLPLRTASVDACVCTAVLHHLSKPEDRVGALREIRRVLVPGGSVFLSVWARDQPRFGEHTSIRIDPHGDALVPWRLEDGTSVPRYYHLFDQRELEGAIIESRLHGDTFFVRHGNVFGRATKHG